MSASLRRLFIGSPLPSAAETEQRLNRVRALAVFSSDALSSVAYATEEILLVLVLAGTGALHLALPISLAIAALMVLVIVSYYQTIHAYPSGGGAYIVAHDNLGAGAGLVAAAALLTDYELTVAVSITAGIAAITSAFPELLPWRVWLCLLAITLITWANLRGVRESGTLFAVPTYTFIVLFGLLIIIGLIRTALGQIAPPVGAASPLGQAVQPLTQFLILRAFASGCTALTGVEAISNGVPAFKPPEARHAGQTLIAMAVLLASMFVGVTILVRSLEIAPSVDQTVVSSLAHSVFGNSLFYYAVQAATMLILVLAANTSFAGFPRLAAILASDRYLPRQFASVGDRLVYSNGIIFLAVIAAALVIIFRGETHNLIPLYAVGVFLSFTLSQAGMVRRWFRERGSGWAWKALLNGLGALATASVLMVVVATKFIHGAWIIILLIPLIVWLFNAIHSHFLSLAAQLSLSDEEPQPWASDAIAGHLKVVVPVSGIHRGSLEALRFARSLTTHVTAVIVDQSPETTAAVREKWEQWGHGIPLIVLESPYRSTIRPLLAYLEEADREDPSDELAVVVLPEFVPAQEWHRLLHNGTAVLLRAALVYQRGLRRHDRIIINVPYHLQH